MPNSDSIFIRQAERAELQTLQEIGRATFFEAFAAQNAASDMAKYLDEDFSLKKLAAEFENPESHFFFAEVHHQVVGYLKVNWGAAQTEALLDNALEIERIYVLAKYHGKKIGKALFEKARSVARERKTAAMWLGVWEENTAAIGFYRKQGFVAFGKHPFRLGDDEQTDILMKLDIL